MAAAAGQMPPPPQPGARVWRIGDRCSYQSASAGAQLGATVKDVWPPITAGDARRDPPKWYTDMVQRSKEAGNPPIDPRTIVYHLWSDDFTDPRHEDGRTTWSKKDMTHEKVLLPLDPKLVEEPDERVEDAWGRIRERVRSRGKVTPPRSDPPALVGSTV